MLRRIAGVIYVAVAIAFVLFALLLLITGLQRWQQLLFALVFGLGAIVAFRSARDSFRAARPAPHD